MSNKAIVHVHNDRFAFRLKSDRTVHLHKELTNARKPRIIQRGSIHPTPTTSLAECKRRRSRRANRRNPLIVANVDDSLRNSTAE